MEKLYIWHHLGMGDHILCNGIVRHFSSKYKEIILFVKKQNLKNVKFLYRDLSNISFQDGSGNEDLNVKLFLQINPYINLLKISNNDKFPFDVEFYKNAKLPFNYKWDKFHLERNIEREKEVYYDILGLKDNEDFIFLHDKENKRLKEELIPKNIKIIRPDNKEIKLFEFIYTLEKAKEIHLLNSSFLCLVDTIMIKNNLFYHQYAEPGCDPTLNTNLNWKIYE